MRRFQPVAFYTGLICIVHVIAGCSLFNPRPPPVSTPQAQSLNHIVFLAEENRSFDSYFGAMRKYWAQNGYADESFDGLPQFNALSGASPLQAPAASVPGCDPNAPPPADCSYDPANPVTSYHFQTVCTENSNPSCFLEHLSRASATPRRCRPSVAPKLN